MKPFLVAGGIFLPFISTKNQCNDPYIRHRMELQNEVNYRLETAHRSDLFEERDDQERYKFCFEVPIIPYLQPSLIPLHG